MLTQGIELKNQENQTESYKCTFLVIGRYGLVGSHLFNRLLKVGMSVLGTSRHESSSDCLTIHLDLKDPFANIFLPRGSCSVAFICAGVNLQACEADPIATRFVNVTNLLRIANRLLCEGIHIIYISTNAVFDGTQPYPNEETSTCPTSEYGRQKAEVEARLMDLDNGRGLVSISRFSKIVAPAVPVIHRFLQEIKQGKSIEAFSDLRFSPISLNFAVDSLLAVAQKNCGGIFHFSGEMNMSYAKFAQALVRHRGFHESLVKPIMMQDRGVVPLFRPVYPAMKMAKSREILGTSPQSLDDVVTELWSLSSAPFFLQPHSRV